MNSTSLSPMSVFSVLAIIMAAALYIQGPARLYAALQANGTTAQGVIINVECRKSTRFFYSFLANSHSYTGSGVSIEPCSQFKPGDSIPVVYMASDPSKNFSGNPSDAYRAYILTTIIASLLLPGFATIAFHIWRQKHA